MYELRSKETARSMKNTGESFDIMRVKGGNAAMEKNIKPVIAAIDYIEI